MESVHFSSSVPYELRYRNEVAEKMQCTFNVLDIDYFKHHNHLDFWEFTIITEGSLINYLNGKSYLCEKGQAYFLTNEDCHHVKRKGESQVRYINLMIKSDFLKNYLNAISPSFYEYLLSLPRTFSLPDSVIINIENIIHKANMLTQQEYKTHSNLIFSAIMLVIQHLYSTFVQPTEIKKEWQIKLASVKDTAEFLTYSIQDLCVALNYSKAQLNRIFKEHFGVSPHDYLQEHKFRYVQNVLVFTDEKIIDISSKIGYKNLSQFNVIFKRKFNMTPGEYRKKNRS